jgi:hypothetical protein
MPQVPNFYYNSPHIESAARSLASALAPPDPQELLQRERAKWQYGREQMLAGRQDEKYADTQAVEEAFAKMVTPVYGADGVTIDQTATDKAMLENLSIALQRGGDASTGLKLAGTNSPEFAVKEAVATLQANKLLAGIAARGGVQAGLQDSEHTWKDTNREDEQTFTAERDAKRWAHESNQNFLKQQARMREINARERAKKASGTGSNWHSPPDNILKEITYGLDDMIRQTGRPMSLDKRNQFIDRAIARWQRSGNPTNAYNEQWARSFPKATSYEDVEHDPDIPGGWLSSGTKGALAPIFVDDPEEDLGDVATDTDQK